MPLADRVEWAVFSLLSTAGPISETAFYERIASLFTGHDLPDEGLVRACLDSYRSLASTPDGLITADDLLRRSQEHTDLLARITDAGHHLGMRVWIGRREQSRRTRDGLLARATRRTRAAGLPRRDRPGGRGAGRRRRHLVHPRQGGVPVRGRMDGHARRATASPALAHPAGRVTRPVPGDRARAERARPLQARPVAAPASGARRGELAHHQVGPLARVPRPRAARPRRPRAVSRARPSSWNEPASSCPSSAAEPPRR